MSDYHKFIFDTEQRRFVGKFEEMYQAEVEYDFDAHHQDSLDKRFDAMSIVRMIERRQYHKIVDVGCGKGALLNELSRYSTTAVGLDFSQTAIQRARHRYPKLQFELVDVSSPQALKSFFESQNLQKDDKTLTVMSQVLSYIAEWKKVLELAAKNTDDLVIALYIPENPIGYVKSKEELQSEILEVASILEVATSQDGDNHVFFASTQVR
jgi:trans-aconitate methyltransferase